MLTNLLSSIYNGEFQHTVTIWPSNCIPGDRPKRMKTYGHAKPGTRMFVALFTIAKRKKGNNQNVHQLING